MSITAEGRLGSQRTRRHREFHCQLQGRPRCALSPRKRSSRSLRPATVRLELALGTRLPLAQVRRQLQSSSLSPLLGLSLLIIFSFFSLTRWSTTSCS